MDPVVYRREVRLGVVMYGGVSLAIYMNGVSQELFNLVRATAEGVEPRCEVEEVYRKLGERLGSRFVIDVLSGTSAGGINAVYLAKALTNDADMRGTADVWVDEGNADTLINDEGSLRDASGVKLRKPPPSLLNGDRMLVKLHEAFENMDKPATNGQVKSLVDDLDLFVTTTDLRGRPNRLPLSDKLICESEHRHVLRFRLRKGQSSGDFVPERNHLLAFAARCTSSFPFAFEPMEIGDIKTLLGRDGDEWKGLFEEYRPVDVPGYPEDAFDPKARAYADGGYLDNKPFSHAIDALSLHRSSLPVARKLIYIDPTPERPEDIKDYVVRPDAIRNSIAALSTLPRKERIREDLERVRVRNDLVDRVIRYIGYMDEAADFRNAGTLPLYGEDAQDFAERLKYFGASYGTYHRLKVGTLTERIAERIALAAGVPLGSREHKAITEEVRAWRVESYALDGLAEETLDGPEAADADAGPPTSSPVERLSETAFLRYHDVEYRVRRLSLTLRICDKLVDDPDFRTRLLKGLARWRWPDEEDEVQDFGQAQNRRAFGALIGRAIGAEEGTIESFIAELTRIRPMLAEALYVLRPEHAHREFPTDRGVVEDVRDKGTARAAVSVLLGEWRKQAEAASSQARELSAGAFEPTYLVGPKARSVESSAQSVGNPPDRREISESAVDSPRPPLPEEPEELAKWVLWRYYRYFEAYDVASYPVLYMGEHAGNEMATADVHRISPEDATAIIDERAMFDGDEQKSYRKLAGTNLGNFGAFLDEDSRRLDILWGRLDGAERLIALLTPGDEGMRREFTHEAHRAILAQESTWLFELLGTPKERSVELEEFRSWLKANRDAPHKLDPSLGLNVAARGVSVVGRMVGSIRLPFARLTGSMLDSSGRAMRMGRWFVRPFAGSGKQSVDRWSARTAILLLATGVLVVAVPVLILVVLGFWKACELVAHG